jgi:hypothetical protein
VTSEYSEPCDEYFYALNNLELLWYHALEQLNNNRKHDAVDGDEPERGPMKLYKIGQPWQNEHFYCQ